MKVDCKLISTDYLKTASMTLDSVFSFILIVTLLVTAPGPNGALILKTVPFQGKRNGMANVLGFLTAFYLHGFFSIFGLSALVMGSTKTFFAVKILGALYLAYLGFKTLWSALKYQRPLAKRLVKISQIRKRLLFAYSEGLLTNLLNPKVSLFYLAAFPQFVDFTAGLTLAKVGNALVLITIHAVINFLWFTGVIFLLGRAASWAKSGAIGRFIQGLTGTLLLWFGYRLVTADLDLTQD